MSRKKKITSKPKTKIKRKIKRKQKKKKRIWVTYTGQSLLNKSKEKKKKKRRRRGNVQEEGKKKVKKSNVRMKPMCSCTWAFLSIKQPHFLSLVFSLFLSENFFVGLGPNIYFPFSLPLGPLFIFIPLHPTKHTRKSVPTHFFFKVFHPFYFTSKQTHSNNLTLSVGNSIKSLMAQLHYLVPL